MKILFINNAGGGFAQDIEIEAGTTVAQLFAQRMAEQKASDYLIRVNRQHVPAQQVLVEGDRVSITPTKIEGALRRFRRTRRADYRGQRNRRNRVQAKVHSFRA